MARAFVSYVCDDTKYKQVACAFWCRVVCVIIKPRARACTTNRPRTRRQGNNIAPSSTTTTTTTTTFTRFVCTYACALISLLARARPRVSGYLVSMLIGEPRARARAILAKINRSETRTSVYVRVICALAVELTTKTTTTKMKTTTTTTGHTHAIKVLVYSKGARVNISVPLYTLSSIACTSETCITHMFYTHRYVKRCNTRGQCMLSAH